MSDDISAIHQQLKIETAKLLGYNFENLTGAQQVRVDRAAMLRLELDDIQSKKLNNQPFDAAKYIAVSEALERLVGGDPEKLTNAPNDFSDDMAKLKAEIERLASRRRDDIDRISALLAGSTIDMAHFPAAVEAVERLRQEPPLTDIKASFAALMPVEPEQRSLPPPLPPPPATWPVLVEPLPPPVEEAAPAPWIDPNAGKPPPFVDGNPWSNNQ